MSYEKKTKAGFVNIIGKPNVGKSTLLNSILDYKLSIVTSKPQTTRNSILGIYTKNNVQIVFIDTPGILKPNYQLQTFMVQEIDKSFKDIDLILYIIDVHRFDLEEVKDQYNNYHKNFSNHNTICVINKIDLLKKEEVLVLIDELSKNFPFKEIVPVSARDNFNVDELLKTIISYLPEHKYFYDSDSLTVHKEKFFVSEIIREAALKLYNQEIPYSVWIDIEEFKDAVDKRKVYIGANILIEKESQKKIIIGEKGKMIKMLGSKARKEIESFLGREVYLELFVKVKKDWKNDIKFLRSHFTNQ
jgi:GTPase